MYVSGRTGGQTDRRVHRRPTPKTISLRLHRGGGGGAVLSTGYLVLSSRTQRSASGEAQSRNPSISGQALYHDCAPQLGSILCRHDTCPTQYSPGLRGSILCMQGTQYAPWESILCMEHFVALQGTNPPIKALRQSRHWVWGLSFGVLLYSTWMYTTRKLFIFQIWDNSGIVGVFCGSTLPALIQTSGSSTLIVFQSDYHDNNGQGFTIYYSQLDSKFHISEICFWLALVKYI